MIQANELRIGNWVIYSDEQTMFCVSEIHKSGISVINNMEETWIELYQFEPIPLTEEILLKCDWAGYKTLYINSYFKIDITGCIWYCGDFTGLVIKYLHQLQNLYFALTRAELKINL